MDAQKIDTLILGAGLTGLSTAYHLGDDFLVLEKEDYVGGLAHTFVDQGFHFDITGHWLHLRTPEVKALVAKILPDDMASHARQARVYSHGDYTLYPYQANTFGLPPEVASECLLGFLQARCWDRLNEQAPEALPPAKTFADFILQRLGPGIAKHFMFPYNKKLWTVHPEELDASWCDRFVPVPSIEDVVLGALGQSPQRLGYNTEFLYPKSGGIGRVPQALYSHLDRDQVKLGQAASSLDLQSRCLTSSDGTRFTFKHLVSTLPLNRLLQICSDLPQEIQSAASHLRHTTLTYFDVAAKGANPDQPHWSYVPEEDFPSYRIGSFSAVEPSMAPADQRNFYVEFSHQGPDLQLRNPEDKVVEQLCQMRLLNSPDDVIFMRRRTIPVAYVLPGADVEPARLACLEFLQKNNILSTGRYGAWVYAAMEDALVDGMQAAKTVTGWRQE